jgi:hypothetical protein
MNLGIFGPQGSGKSFFAMLLARHLQKIDSSLDIYTNMNIDGDNCYVINDLATLPLEDGRNKIFIVDEAFFTLNSRSSSSKQNVIWSQVFALFRKSDVVLSMFITHRPRMIDVNIREQLQHVLMCRKNPTQFDYLLIDTMTMLNTPIQIPKIKEVFDYANYNTKDFPLPIKVDSLINHPLFQTTK